MIKHRLYGGGLTLLALATLCAPGEVRPQENPTLTSDLPTIIDHKRAESLIMLQSAPEYPPIAKVNYIQGQVSVRLTVNGKGKVASAHIVSGNALLAESALKATLRWLYHPLSTARGPSGFITTVKVKYSLNFRGTDLTPEQAERDFMRQVKPPQILCPTERPHQGDFVHVRLLVNDQGEVVDVDAPPASEDFASATRAVLEGWTFRPARWGSLPVPSYLDVDVPVHPAASPRQAASAAIR